MIPVTLGRAEYRDKVLACWMGKNVKTCPRCGARQEECICGHG